MCAHFKLLRFVTENIFCYASKLSSLFKMYFFSSKCLCRTFFCDRAHVNFFFTVNKLECFDLYGKELSLNKTLDAQNKSLV
jgi:hypothetical protein